MSIAIGHRQRRGSWWRELLARRRQRLLAGACQQVLDDARRPPRGPTARVTVERHQVLAAAWDIELLVARLREDRPVSEVGLAQLRALLTDADGPLYNWAEPGTLRRRVRVVSEAME
jgi:hypothetical protein